jgi:hypothetical protein
MEAQNISAQKRREILEALRRGTVPRRGLEDLAVGLSRFESAVDEMLDHVESGNGAFKAIRGDYGCGKTFFSRWLQERAKQRNFAAAEVQISETETPLHRLETVYRRLIERLSLSGTQEGAFREIIDSWFYSLEEDVINAGAKSESEVLEATEKLMEKRLGEVARTAPAFSAVLRGYRRALAEGDTEIAEGLIAWLGGQPNVSSKVKAAAGIKGEIDHKGALTFLQGLLMVLRDSGNAGLVLVLDEVETLQRVRSDVREKSLNALRQLIDELDSGRFPGLVLIITGTPIFFDGPQGIKKLQPLAQRLATEFQADNRFDNPRAPQVRLMPFKHEALVEVGQKVRSIFVSGLADADRVRAMVDDKIVSALASGIAGRLGGEVGLAPRIFLKKLVAELLDVVELHPDFNPKEHYKPVIAGEELNDAERSAAGPVSPDEIPLNL